MSHFFKDDLGRVMFHADQPGGGAVVSVANADYRMRHVAEWQAFCAVDEKPAEVAAEETSEDAAKKEQIQEEPAVEAAQDSAADQS